MYVSGTNNALMKWFVTVNIVESFDVATEKFCLNDIIWVTLYNLGIGTGAAGWKLGEDGMFLSPVCETS